MKETVINIPKEDFLKIIEFTYNVTRTAPTTAQIHEDVRKNIEYIIQNIKPESKKELLEEVQSKGK